MTTSCRSPIECRRVTNSLIRPFPLLLLFPAANRTLREVGRIDPSAFRTSPALRDSRNIRSNGHNRKPARRHLIVRHRHARLTCRSPGQSATACLTHGSNPQAASPPHSASRTQAKNFSLPAQTNSMPRRKPSPPPPTICFRAFMYPPLSARCQSHHGQDHKAHQQGFLIGHGNGI